MQPAKPTLPGWGEARSQKVARYRETRRTTGRLAGGLLVRYGEFAPISSPPDSLTTEAMLNLSALRFRRHRGIYRPDGALLPIKPGPGRRLPLVGPRPGQRTRRVVHVLPIVPMSSDRLFLDGLLASIARLRFTGTHRL